MDRTLEERLAVIEEILHRMEARLFGNGQPGEIDELQRRIARLESWAWRVGGAAGAITLGYQIASQWLVRS